MNMQKLDLKLVKKATIVTLTILCAGCAVKKTLPSQSDIAYANYGSPKSIQDFDAKIRQGLKDPDSAKIACMPPKKGWFEIKSLPNQYGYVSICEVNAKNGFGGYTGVEKHVYSFVDAGFIAIPDVLVANGTFEFHPVP